MTLRATCQLLMAGAVWLASTAACARIVEQQIDVPVSVQDMYGKLIEQPIRVTLFFDDVMPRPRPVMVINHGRRAAGEERAAYGRVRYPEASLHFARAGFIVAVPTRAGYGVSGGEDPEYSGSCGRNRYPPGYLAAAGQTEAVLQAVYARPNVRRDRSVVLGQSYGGATAITVASRQVAGVVAAVNIAGGGGGDPKTHPGVPCSADLLEDLFASYGPGARMPTLWVYTENDQYFGAVHPRNWFKAFRAAGGNGEMVQFPPHGDDGHSLFTRFPAVWQPVVDDFLRRQGFPIPESP